VSLNRDTERIEMDEPEVTIRPYEDRDEAEVVGVWLRSGRVVYTFLAEWQTLTTERAGEIFRQVIRPRCALWVAVTDGRVVGFLAMKGSYIDRMYVDPSEWRKGCGTRLIEAAKNLSHEGLELCTHQANQAARTFYEKHGFTAVRFGISPAPESAPDVEYHWRPE
jgi:GNAT superfamily N-acetyltransferase